MMGLVMAASNLFLFVGCLKRQKNLLIPWLVFKMIGIVTSFVLVAVLVGIGLLDLVFGARTVAADDNEEAAKPVFVGDLTGDSALVTSSMLLALNRKFILLS